MTALLMLAARSAWNRRFVLALVAVSIALSTILLLGIAQMRRDVRETFVQSISGTDLIVGARTGAVQLLLYSVFRLGGATNNVRWSSVQAIRQLPGIDWLVPISLGDTYRGAPVVATTADYFQHFQYGDHQTLKLRSGALFSKLHDAVIGAEVASRLDCAMGDQLILSHGDGELEDNDHADQPFTVVGILAPTGTPVDRSVHIDLRAMEALHAGWVSGAHVPGLAPATESAAAGDAQPKSVTAVLLGLKNRAAALRTQRTIDDYAAEPLMAVLPNVALDQLWEVIGVGERGLVGMSVLVSLVSLAGLVAAIMAGLNERRRELAILRAVGAGPWHVLLLLAAEGALVTCCGALLGVLVLEAGVAVLGGWVQSRWGIAVPLRLPDADDLALLGSILVGGFLASLVPALRAYRLSLVDGLSPKV